MTDQSVELVKKLEKLSLIELSDSERERMAKEIGVILKFFDKINELDLSNVDPLFHPISEGKLREDTPHEGLTRDEALANVGRKENGFIVGPRIHGE